MHLNLYSCAGTNRSWILKKSRLPIVLYRHKNSTKNSCTALSKKATKALIGGGKSAQSSYETGRSCFLPISVTSPPILRWMYLGHREVMWMRANDPMYIFRCIPKQTSWHKRLRRVYRFPVPHCM